MPEKRFNELKIYLFTQKVDFESILVRNTYLEAEAAARVAPLVAVCLAFGEAGKVPLDLIQEMERRLATV